MTKIPITKLIRAISQTFPEEPRDAPNLEPRVCMDISAPMVKTASPAIRQRTPNKNIKNTPGDRGVRVTLSAITIAAMGRIDVRDS